MVRQHDHVVAHVRLAARTAPQLAQVAVEGGQGELGLVAVRVRVVGHGVVTHEVAVDDRHAPHHVLLEPEEAQVPEEGVGHGPLGQTLDAEAQAGPLAVEAAHHRQHEARQVVPHAAEHRLGVGGGAEEEEVEVRPLPVSPLAGLLAQGADGHQALGRPAAHEGVDAGAPFQ